MRGVLPSCLRHGHAPATQLQDNHCDPIAAADASVAPATVTVFAVLSSGIEIVPRIPFCASPPPLGFTMGLIVVTEGDVSIPRLTGRELAVPGRDACMLPLVVGREPACERPWPLPGVGSRGWLNFILPMSAGKGICSEIGLRHVS